MSLEISPNHDLIIKARVAEYTDWRPSVADLNIPSKVSFIVDGTYDFLGDIKKIVWNYGDFTKHIVISNRKQKPQSVIVDHIFRQKNTLNIESLTIQASVYSNDKIYIPTPFIIHNIKQKAVNYVDPEQFKKEIMEYYKVKTSIPDSLAISVQQIATRLAFAPNFINYTYREEMIGDALIKMIEALKGHKFNPEKGKPFSYFTKIAYHAFCNRIKKEKKAREALTHYQNEVYSGLIDDGVIPTEKNTHHVHDENVYVEVAIERD